MRGRGPKPKSNAPWIFGKWRGGDGRVLAGYAVFVFLAGREGYVMKFHVGISTIRENGMRASSKRTYVATTPFLCFREILRRSNACRN